MADLHHDYNVADHYDDESYNNDDQPYDNDHHDYDFDDDVVEPAGPDTDTETDTRAEA